MDPELQPQIRNTWRLLERQGCDHATGSEGTVRTVLHARPGIDASRALALVRWVLAEDAR